MTGYKKAVIFWKDDNGALAYNECIVKLEIPEDAKIVSPNLRVMYHGYQKKRCDRAIVKDITYYTSEPGINDHFVAISPHSLEHRIFSLAYEKIIGEKQKDHLFVYRKGEEVRPKELFSDDDTRECASGIHFFKDIRAAFEYSINNIFMYLSYYLYKEGLWYPIVCEKNKYFKNVTRSYVNEKLTKEILELLDEERSKKIFEIVKKG